MVKTKENIKKALLELINETSVDDISVISICNKLGIIRQTFYFHYKDIYDLIDSIFLDLSYEFLSKKYTRTALFSNLLKYIEANYLFLNKISNSNAVELLKDFFYDVFLGEIINEGNKDKLVQRSSANILSSEFVELIAKNDKFSSKEFEKVYKFGYLILDGDYNGRF